MAQNSLTSTDKEIVIDLTLDGAKEAIAAISAATKEIAQLKKEKKAYDDMLKEEKELNAEQWQDYIRVKTALKDQNNTLKANQKVLDEQVKAYKKNNDSINSMRAHLKLLRAQYEDLSKAERDSAKGDELIKKIKAESAAIKQLEADQGDFRSNVGNYQDIWNAEADQIKKFGDVLSSVFGSNSIFGKAATVVQGFGRVMNQVGKDMQTSGTQITDSAKTTASETTKAYTEMGQSVQTLGSEMQSETKVVQGFGKALYETTEPSKEAAASMENAAKAATDLANDSSALTTGAATVATSTAEMATSTSKLAGAFGMAGQAAKGFSAQLLKLMTNPYVALIGAIVAVVIKLVQAFKQNDQAMTALKASFSAFQPILNAINQLFEKLVGAATKVVTALGKAAAAVAGFFGGESYKKAQKQAEELVIAQDNLEEAERQYTEAHAENEAKIADLRAKAIDAENYTIEERKKFLQESIDIERADLEAKKANAEERLRIETQLALQEKGYTEMTAEAWNSLTDEVKDHISELRAGVSSIDKEMSDFERSIGKQLNSLNKKATTVGASASSARKERLKNEQEAMQEVEAIYLSTLQDMYAKEEAQLRANTKKQIEQIELKLKTEKNLTTKAREALNKQIVLLEAKLQSDIYDIRIKSSRENLKKQLEEQKAWYETLLNGVKGEAKETVQIELIKINTKATIQSLNEVLENFKHTVDTIKKDAAELSEDELQLKYGVELDQKGIDTTRGYLNAMMELISQYDNEYLQKQTKVSNSIIEINKQEQRNILKVQKEGQIQREELAQQYAEIMAQVADTKELEAFYYNEVEKTKILQEQAERRVTIAQENLNRLTSLTNEERQALYETDEEYQLAVAEATLQVTESEVALADAVRATTAAIQAQKDAAIDTFTSVAQSVNNVIGSVQSIFDTLAESDEKYKKYSTALAMMQILVSTAISIANAIQGATAAAAATGVAAPFTTPVFIAEMVAIVAGAIASATATLKKAQSSAPAKPKFSGGGPVDKSTTGGPIGNRTTTRTDDTVDAKLSLGEYVIQSKIVKKYGIEFFNQLNETKTNKKLGLPLKFSTGGSVPSVQNIQSITAQIDYSQMKDMFTEVVQEIQPVVSVREINSVQNRVNVKEQTASYN